MQPVTKSTQATHSYAGKQARSCIVRHLPQLPSEGAPRRFDRQALTFAAVSVAVGVSLMLAACGDGRPIRELSGSEVQERLATCAAAGWDAQPVTGAWDGRILGVRCVERKVPDPCRRDLISEEVCS
jgi:hypothetical protein